MKKVILPFIVIFLMAILTGCAPTVAEARFAFCQDLVAYGQAVRSLQNVNATTTVEELNKAVEYAAATRQDMLASAGDLRAAKVQTIENTWETLSDTVQNPPDDVTLGGLALTIRAQATLLNAEIARLNNVVCRR